MLAITILSIFALALILIIEAGDSDDIDLHKNDPWFEE